MAVDVLCVMRRNREQPPPPLKARRDHAIPYDLAFHPAKDSRHIHNPLHHPNCPGDVVDEVGSYAERFHVSFHHVIQGLSVFRIVDLALDISLQFLRFRRQGSYEIREFTDARTGIHDAYFTGIFFDLIVVHFRCWLVIRKTHNQTWDLTGHNVFPAIGRTGMAG